MPRVRKSAAIMEISGAYSKNPKRRRRDVEAAGAIGPWGDLHSTTPSEVWGELVASVPPGLLTRADRWSLEYAVRLMVELRRDPANFPASRGSLLVNLLGKLGCLPASRHQMNAPEPKDKDDPAEKYFR
jgi:hypothetical protein